MKTRVVLVDDHLAVREMLGAALERDGGYEICGEARTGLEALKLVRRVQPRVVVIDLLLPELSGAEVVRTLRAENVSSRLLVFSGTWNRELIVEALQARPHGFVHKEDPLSTFRDALRTVAGGGLFFTPFASDALDQVRGAASGWDALSVRERAVLQMIAEGRSNKEMADRLSVSPKTVEHYRAHVMEKLDLHDVASLTRCAVRRGLVEV